MWVLLLDAFRQAQHMCLCYWDEEDDLMALREGKDSMTRLGRVQLVRQRKTNIGFEGVG